MPDFVIRPLQSMAEMKAAMEFQTIYWGDNPQGLVPDHMLYSIVNYGGHVLAAYDEDRLAGIVVGFLGVDPYASPNKPASEKLVIMSKRLLVLPLYRGHGLGYRLKLAQRDFALVQGINHIMWTFDPVFAANGYLNLHKLGGTSQQYLINYFGEDNRHQRLSADRLLVNWWLKHRHVQERIAGEREPTTYLQYVEQGAVTINPTTFDAQGLLIPTSTLQMALAPLLLVEVPVDFDVLAASRPELKQEWRQHLRDVFKSLFAHHYTVMDFVWLEGEPHERAFFVLKSQFEDR